MAIRHVLLRLSLLTAAWVSAGDIQVMMSIIPSGSIVKYINDDLNLTCRVNSNAALRYLVTWTLPIKTKIGEKNRVGFYRQPNEVTVTIYQLQEADSGQYFCEVSGNDIHYRQTLRVTVKSSTPDKQKCSDRLFPCNGGPCIPRRYTCDGFVDCPDGKDETPATCGSDDPCKGKIRCDDGRCMSPDLCCDPTTNPSCVSLYLVPCCHKLVSQNVASSHPQYSDINFIQSTIYTIVSCAVAFIFITLIMIIAICRIHMKRSVMSMHPSSSSHPVTRRRGLRWPWDCLHRRRPETHHQHHHARVLARWSSAAEDMASNESLYQSPRTYPCSISSTGSFVVTYNSAEGVQLIERLPKPPPYTEGAPTRLGPPPPYCSVEDLRRSSSNHQPPSLPEAHCPAYQSALLEMS